MAQPRVKRPGAELLSLWIGELSDTPVKRWYRIWQGLSLGLRTAHSWGFHSGCCCSQLRIQSATSRACVSTLTCLSM